VTQHPAPSIGDRTGGILRVSGVPPAVHRTIECVDVQGFSDRRRTNPDQVAVRSGLYGSLQAAFARSGISWDLC